MIVTGIRSKPNLVLLAKPDDVDWLGILTCTIHAPAWSVSVSTDELEVAPSLDADEGLVVLSAGPLGVGDRRAWVPPGTEILTPGRAEAGEQIAVWRPYNVFVAPVDGEVHWAVRASIEGLQGVERCVATAEGHLVLRKGTALVARYRVAAGTYIHPSGPCRAGAVLVYGTDPVAYPGLPAPPPTPLRRLREVLAEGNERADARALSSVIKLLGEEPTGVWEALPADYRIALLRVVREPFELIDTVDLHAGIAAPAWAAEQAATRAQVRFFKGLRELQRLADA